MVFTAIGEILLQRMSFRYIHDPCQNGLMYHPTFSPPDSPTALLFFVLNTVAKFLYMWSQKSEFLDEYLGKIQETHRYYETLIETHLWPQCHSLGLDWRCCSSEDKNPKIIIRVISFELDQPICPGYINVTDRQMDGQTGTDGRTTYDSNTALALRASRGKNVNEQKK